MKRRQFFHTFWKLKELEGVDLEDFEFDELGEVVEIKGLDVVASGKMKFFEHFNISISQAGVGDFWRIGEIKNFESLKKNTIKTLKSIVIEIIK